MRSLLRRSSMELRRISDCARDLRRDKRGVSAVEFALYAPVILLLLVGEFALGEAITISRKVAITGNTVVNLITQYSSVTSSQVATILNAATQIAAPYSTSNMVIVVAELTTDANNNTTVTWSQSLNGNALIAGAKFTPPPGVAQANTSLIYGKVYYTYSPPVGSNLFSAIPISYSLYMNPRITASIPLT